MAEILHKAGYAAANTPDAADVILVNTCSVREKSQTKVISALGRYRQLKKKKPDLILGVAGCVAQQEGDKLFTAAPYIDLVFSPDHIKQLPNLLHRARQQKAIQVGFVDMHEYAFLRAVPEQGLQDPTALVTIQKGCDNHCSYCIVPLVRGPELSRPATDILVEIESLVAAGVREVTLIGQNVNSYRGYDGTNDDFVRLLRAVNSIPGLQRIRFTTSHPKDFTNSLAYSFRELSHLCPWLHLPVQSGATETLTHMNRGYTREDYLRIIDKVKEVCPQISLGTDVIVGFPGESEAAFEETVSLLKKIRFNYAYMFKYSPRPGTVAASLEDDVPENEKNRRLHHIQKIQDEITRDHLSAMLNQTVEILVEGPSRKGLPQVSGRTPGNHVVNFECGKDEVRGNLVTVQIVTAGSHSLMGKMIHNGLEGI